VARDSILQSTYCYAIPRYHIKLNATYNWLTFMLLIRQILASNRCPILVDVFRGFLHFFQTKVGYYLKVDHEHFLPRPFIYIYIYIYCKKKQFHLQLMSWEIVITKQRISRWDCNGRFHSLTSESLPEYRIVIGWNYSRHTRPLYRPESLQDEAHTSIAVC
jgi:hypothetical protein